MLLGAIYVSVRAAFDATNLYHITPLSVYRSRKQSGYIVFLCIQKYFTKKEQTERGHRFVYSFYPFIVLKKLFFAFFFFGICRAVGRVRVSIIVIILIAVHFRFRRFEIVYNAAQHVRLGKFQGVERLGNIA